MSLIPIEELKGAIAKTMAEHEPASGTQWYIDEFTIDCDAKEFWYVLGKVIDNVTQPD